MNRGEMIRAKPFLKWLGGKRRLIPHVEQFIPTDFKRYVEPFVGAGAFLFHMQPECAFIADVNADLMNVYDQLKHDPLHVINGVELLKLQHSAEKYYVVRTHFNNDRFPNYTRAARFIYLNCKCFNGLCRYNKKGGFNAPLHKISHETRPLPSMELLQAVSDYLQKVELFLGDFRELPIALDENDFAVIDPPYWPVWAQGFTKYAENAFVEKDQRDLALLFRLLTEEGVRTMLWNSNAQEVFDLYSSYKIVPIEVKSCVGSKSYDGKKKNRIELCIMNYDIEHGII